VVYNIGPLPSPIQFTIYCAFRNIDLYLALGIQAPHKTLRKAVVVSSSFFYLGFIGTPRA